MVQLSVVMSCETESTIFCYPYCTTEWWRWMKISKGIWNRGRIGSDYNSLQTNVNKQTIFIILLICIVCIYTEENITCWRHVLVAWFPRNSGNSNSCQLKTTEDLRGEKWQTREFHSTFTVRELTCGQWITLSNPRSFAHCQATRRTDSEMVATERKERLTNIPDYHVATSDFSAHI